MAENPQTIVFGTCLNFLHNNHTLGPKKGICRVVGLVGARCAGPYGPHGCRCTSRI